MNVSLTHELDSWIDEKVKNGMYQSASEVIREGLRLLIRQETQREAMLKDLRAELQIGIDQIAAGETINLDQGFIDSIQQKIRK